jgi:hypothetical protein
VQPNNKVLEGVGKIKPPAAGIGRKKGVPNKTTKIIKEMISGALDELGGQSWLVEQARAEPKAFMQLIGKLLPLQLANDPDAPLTNTKITELSDEEISARITFLKNS